MINKTMQNDKITDIKLKNALRNNGYDNVSVNKSGNKFKVTFDSGNIYTITDDGKVQKYEKVEPTAVYAKLYTDGTLILSSTDYTDNTRTVAENGDYRDVSQKVDYYTQTEGGPPILLGDYPGWINPNVYYPSSDKIKKVIIYDKISPRKTSYWFAGSYGIEEIQGLEKLDTSNVTDMQSMFAHCYKIPKINVSNFDTSNVTNMNAMFKTCSAVNSLDVSGFDTSHVTDMAEMFGSCSELNYLDVSGFDTSHATDMGIMFFNCLNLKYLDVSGFNTSNVTNMTSMFQFCKALESLKLSNFDTKNVTNMSSMFYGCTALESLNLSNFNTKNVTNFNNMFKSVNARVIIGTNWNSTMTESATEYNGTFEVK